MERKAEPSRADPSGDISPGGKEYAWTKSAVVQEDNMLWETMSMLSVNTNNMPFQPSKHCEQRMRQRDVRPIDVQRAKKRGHKEVLGHVVRYTYNEIVVISDPISGRDITTWALAPRSKERPAPLPPGGPITDTEAPQTETRELRVETEVSEEEGLGLSVRRAEADDDDEEEAGKASERMVVQGFRREGTAFEKSGVRPGDVVIGVQAVDVSSLPYHKTMKLIKRAVASGRAAITFLNLVGYTIMVPEGKAWQFMGAFGWAIKRMSPLGWTLLPPLHGQSLYRLLVECTGPKALKQMQGLVECGRADGFFAVPFRLEGQVKDERALRAIEERTGTTIRMQINKDIEKIVVLVCPGAGGEVGRVGHAVKLIRGLMTEPPKRKDVLGRNKTGPGYGGGRGPGAPPGLRGVR